MNRDISVLSHDAVKAADRGNIIEAVKVVRKETGLGLKEAKDLVDSYVKNKGKLTSPTLHRPEMPPEAVAALRNGKLIEAIKLFREKNDIGLKDAKEAVEEYLEQNPATRKRFKEASAREGKRVITIVFLLVGLLAVGYFFATGEIF